MDRKINTEWEVLTSDGYQDFYGIKKTRKQSIKIYFDDGTHIVCSLEHKFYENKKYVYANTLKIGDCLSKKKIVDIQDNGEAELYDLLEVENGHHYTMSGVEGSNCAFIPKNIWEKFYTSTMPTISSGKESKLILVSTPNGENHYYDFWTKAVDGKSNMVPYEVNWWDVPGRDEEWRKEILKTMSEDQFNVEYGNSFDSGTNTLIAPYIFARLSKNILSPLQSTSTLKIYETPAKNHKYILTVDCAQGTGLDYSTISVIDITTNPYKQVAVFKDNTISHLSFPQIIMQLGMKYNMAEVLIESNDIGNTILHILNYDIEYENIVKTFTGVTGKPILGQKTTIKTKSVGCSRIKDMLESGMLIILDSDTLTEFRHFSLSGQSYAADTGYHDDLVMGLVNFAYYASTPQFRMKYDENFTDEYRKEYDEKIMETLAPLPIFSSNMRDVDAADISWLRD